MAVKAAAVPSTTTNVAAELEQLLSTKAVSSGSKNLAAEFERIARPNGHVVTYQQAAAILTKAPSDLAFAFRAAMGKCLTIKGKQQSTVWQVMKLSNGEYAHPAATKTLIAQLQAQSSK
jgi:hypothetical protein